MATPSSNGSAELAIKDPALIARFAEMVGLLPAAEDTEGGAERIIEAILNAKTWEDLDAPWRARGGEAYLGKPQRIERVTTRPSDYAKGLGVYVVVEAVDLSNGEAITWTTGSISIVAQLVKAYCVGGLPLFATIRQAERPTADGYYPQHLEVTDSGGPGVVDAAPAKPKGKPKADQQVMDEPAPY